MTNPTENLATRNQDLPLFEPHVPTFFCAPVQTVPFDAQTDEWFREARALESPEIYIDDRDYKKIVALTRQAAERQHWQAMLNLASFIIEGRDPPHGAEDALKLVERAMQLGAPSAYDRMGTYYMNGTGVTADATRAYAFWQRAARMGNPDALTFLGKKMQYKEDQPNASGWANAAVGTRMLECAYSHGDGNAAFELSLVYSIPFDHHVTKEDLTRALNVLHEGVKLGCQKCAARLSLQFDDPSSSARMIAPYPDKSRAARYEVLSRALDFDPDRRLPNLDKILPLPPADLPPWNGDRDTLINAARGVSHPPPAPHSPSAYLERKERFYLDAEYRLAPTDDTTPGATAPYAGYWQPATDDKWLQHGGAALTTYPALYRPGESFDRVYAAHPDGKMDVVSGLTWRHWRTVRHDQGTISPPVVSGRTRATEPPAVATICSAGERCPVGGTWQPWMHAEHPMQIAVNQYWRQAWLVAGQRFPDPQLDWMLDVVAASDITWPLMDGVGVDICPA